MADPTSTPPPTTTTLAIGGMTCGNCARHVREALCAVAGVTTAAVDLANGTARVTHRADLATAERLVAAVVDEGYEAHAVG